MNKEEIAKQLELYSNSIVAFIVFQSLAFCYNFGTSENFNSILKNSKSLSLLLILIFILAYALALYANRYISRKLQEFSEEYSPIVKATYMGKSIVISIFGFLQITVTICYALFPLKN
ncbi:MAG: hypothetical protein NTW65_10505 [Deltaproteobacteria bacterium]|nr:hypothetical protein [Deltaproteobacteria bacterium]